MSHPVSIAAVIFSPDRKQVLLIQRRDVPVWVLPGGGIEPGESPQEALLREILEETGFTVKIDRLVGNYFPVNRLAKHTQLFECSIQSGTSTLNEECRDIRFFPLDRLPKLIPPPYPDWIREGLIIQPPLNQKLTKVNYLALARHMLFHPLLVLRFILARLGFPINTID